MTSPGMTGGAWRAYADVRVVGTHMDNTTKTCTEWAWEQTGLSARDKYVLVYLASVFTPESGRAWASYRQMSKATGFAMKSGNRAVRSLQEQGLLRVEKWVVEGRQSLVNRYSFPPFDGTAAEIVTVDASDGATIREITEERTLVSIPG